MNQPDPGLERLPLCPVAPTERARSVGTETHSRLPCVFRLTTRHRVGMTVLVSVFLFPLAFQVLWFWPPVAGVPVGGAIVWFAWWVAWPGWTWLRIDADEVVVRRLRGIRRWPIHEVVEFVPGSGPGSSTVIEMATTTGKVTHLPYSSLRPPEELARLNAHLRLARSLQVSR
jgi:hypothetical protein